MLVNSILIETRLFVNFMNKRNAYHTTLKELVHYGLLPDKQLKQLPKSNRWRWENDNYNRFVGSDINDVALKFADEIKAVSQFPKMLHAYANLNKVLLSIIATSNEMSASIRKHKDKVVEAVLKTQDLIPITKAVEVFNISRGTFNTWIIDVKHKCEKSYFNRCNRIYSNQIIPEEVMQIKKALTSPRTSHWSMKSVYLHGIKNNEITVSINTFYNVNRLLGIRDTKNRKKKKRHKKGIRANAPNKIWHADITVFKTLDGVKHYIYLVMDKLF